MVACTVGLSCAIAGEGSLPLVEVAARRANFRPDGPGEVAIRVHELRRTKQKDNEDQSQERGKARGGDNAKGFFSTCHAGQVFDSHNGRPADIWVEGYPGHRAGLAIDCTIVSATDGRRTAAHREQMKITKYSTEVARHPELGFKPFAIDLDGRLGPSAWTLLQEWARIQASRKATGRSLAEARDWVIATIAHAFATGTIRHIQSYYDKQDRAVSGSGLASTVRAAASGGGARARSARRIRG